MHNSTSSGSGLLRWPIWLTYAVLFAVAIPWYWPADDERLWLGIPLWAAVSIAGSGLITLFTVGLLLLCWPDQETPTVPADE